MEEPDEDYEEANPEYDKFVEDLEVIHGEGDLQKAYHDMLSVVELNISTKRGERITYSFLLAKFKEMWTKWNDLYKAAEEKEGGRYLPKKARDEKKNFEQFLSERLYEQSFKTIKGSPQRNAYLFGPTPIKELKKQLDGWKETWDTKKDPEN